MRSAPACVCIVIVILAAGSAWSQGNPVGAAPPQAPVGHRQPTARDLNPDGARGLDQPADVSPESAPSRGENARARAGGLPTLNVEPSCEAAGRGSVVLGRDKKACLGDETTAQDTLRQTRPGGQPVMSSCCPASRFCGMPATSVMPTHLRATTARSVRVVAGANRRGSQWPVWHSLVRA